MIGPSVRFSQVVQRLTTAGPVALLVGRGFQLLNAFLLSTVVVRRFGLSTMGTFALGFIAVAVIPQLMSLGLTSELPFSKRPFSEIVYIASVTMLAAMVPLTAVVYVYSRLMSTGGVETTTIFVVAISGCLSGLQNVGITLSVLEDRTKRAAISPMAETVAILLGGLIAKTGLAMALFFVLGRLAGVLLLWPRTRWSTVPLKEVYATTIQGTHYLALDTLAVIADQVGSVVLSVTVSRADLGLFRLCQQLGSAAETPGWSYMQAKYPLLVSRRANEVAVWRSMSNIGAAVSVMCSIGAFFMAFVAFKMPVVGLMMVPISVAVYGRYRCHFGDQQLRARGSLRPCFMLALVRLGLSVIFIRYLARTFGAWGAVWSTTATSLIMAFLYARIFPPEAMPDFAREPLLDEMTEATELDHEKATAGV